MPARTRTIRQLQRELNAKKRGLVVLRRRRAKAAARLAAIDKEIAVLTGAGPGPKVGRKKKKVARKRGRPAGKKSAKKVARKRRRATGKPLVAYMRQVLAKAPRGMRAGAIAAAVTKAGYKSFSKDFNAVVAKTLLDPKLFQRVSRGVYKLAK
jgi:hypothetical protein